VRVVAFLHVPKSPYGAVSMGYGRIRTALESRGHTLDILTPDDLPGVRGLNARLHVLAFPFAVAWWLWRRRSLYDLAVFHSYAGWVFNLRKRGMRTITAFHGLETLEYAALMEERRGQGQSLSWRYRLTYGRLMNAWLGLSCRRSDRVLCLNSDEAREFVTRGWAPAGRITRITHGVPPDSFVNDRAYPGRAARLLVVSQWLERKGIRYIAAAFTALVREGRDVQLVCAGTRADDSTVLAAFPEDVRARVLNLAEAPHHELAAQYRSADVYLHASLLEGLSRAQTEAMAAALPIVTTRCGAAIDFLVDGESCLLVPMRDSHALAAAIRRLLDDPALRERLGRAAHAIAARDMDLQRTLDFLVDTYEATAR
jgi:glycosyltransferase involved in cell wall biosynthesis